MKEAKEKTAAYPLKLVRHGHGVYTFRLDRFSDGGPCVYEVTPSPVRGCSLRAHWKIRVPVKVGFAGESSREAMRCNVHGREWAERHDLKFPPMEG